MTPAHYDHLKAQIAPLADRLRAHRLDLERQHRDPDPRYLPVRDPERRLRWDAFYASRIQSFYGYQDFDYTDAHIETAVRAIFKELGI